MNKLNLRQQGDTVVEFVTWGPVRDVMIPSNRIICLFTFKVISIYACLYIERMGLPCFMGACSVALSVLLCNYLFWLCNILC